MWSPIRAVSLYLPLLLCGACFVDLDDRCGKDQIVDEFGACSCREGSVLSDDGRCIDAPPPPAGLGVACSDAETPCADETFSHCQENAIANYCTNEGGESGECADGYACNEGQDEAFCERAPVGQGKTCSSDSDCVGGEATYCETTLSNQCLVRDCSEGSCFQGWECCDLVGMNSIGLVIRPFPQVTLKASVYRLSFDEQDGVASFLPPDSITGSEFQIAWVF